MYGGQMFGFIELGLNIVIDADTSLRKYQLGYHVGMTIEEAV
jgi:hypothetical protein